MTVNLMEDTQKLEEVVVVGYGTQKKVNMTGAVAQIDSKALENRPVQNVSTALQGTMPVFRLLPAVAVPDRMVVRFACVVLVH